MPDERIASHEERLLVLRDKAAREGFVVGDDVLDYIANKYALATTLKGALINVSAFASRKGVPVTMSIARLVLDGIRDKGGQEQPVPTPDASATAPVATGGVIVPDPEPTEWQQTPKPALVFEPAEQPMEPSIEQQTEEPVEESVVPADQPGPDASFTDTLFVPPPAVAPVPAQMAEPPVDVPDESELTAPEEAETVVPVATEHVIATSAFAPIASAQPVAPAAAEHVVPVTAGQPVAVTEAAEPAVVWFAPMRSTKKESLVKRAGELLKHAGLKHAIDDGDIVAIKLHFGEEGNTGFVHPVFLRETVRRVRKEGGKPFLTDSNTLYRGKRANSVDHITCAVRNGFSFSTVNAPIIIADGIDGRDGVDVPIEGFKHFESVRIGSAAAHADAMVVVTHVKGHEATGFGGAMKNVGMGLGTRAAKQRMHSDLKPQVNAEKCTACRRCVKSCPVHAIEIIDKVAVIDYELCYGCGECVAACPYGAIGIQWKTEPQSIQEKIVEHCAGALAGKEGKVVYLSFITNVSPDCDCWSFSDAAIVRDIGVLASTDLVAIDQAAYDLVTQAPGLAGGRGEGMAAGEDKFAKITGIDGTVAMAYAEECGLGSRTYELKTLD